MKTVKIRRLNDTDFCKTTVLSPERQWTRLLHMTASYAPYSLSPVRARLPDIFNLEMPLFGGLEHSRVPLTLVHRILERACRPGFELEQNQEVAEVLHEFSTEHVTISRPLPYGSLRLGQDRSLWQKGYLVIDGRPVLFQIDARGSDGLDPEARRVVFSGMHAGVREVDDDFTNARLLIIQVPRIRGVRKPRLHWGDEVELLDYRRLVAMAEVTESLWIEAQREQERRRRGSTGGAAGALL